MNQSGNVLFLILIAIALFAALSYAVSTSMRGGDQSGTGKEKAALLAARFAQYGASLSSAVTRVRVGNGCSEAELNFANPILQHPDYWAGSTNDTAPADGRCDIFGPKGGGQVYWDTRDGMPVGNTIYDGIQFTARVGVQNVGTPASELLMFQLMDDSEAARNVCLAYNERMGVQGDMSAGTTRSLDWTFARGNGIEYDAAPSIQMLIGEDPDPSAFRGEMSGCLMPPSSHDGGSHILYHVLIAR